MNIQSSGIWESMTNISSKNKETHLRFPSKIHVSFNKGSCFLFFVFINLCSVLLLFPLCIYVCLHVYTNLSDWGCLTVQYQQVLHIWCATRSNSNRGFYHFHQSILAVQFVDQFNKKVDFGGGDLWMVWFAFFL